jgi:hypothetical protein
MCTNAIQQLTKLRGIGVQSATVLVREAFVREFATGKSLGHTRGFARRLTVVVAQTASRASARPGTAGYEP